MVDESIITPGYLECDDTPEVTTPNVEYLQRDNYLSEYASDEDKARVRGMLNVPSVDDVYNKTNADILINSAIKTAIETYLNTDDPHKILPQVKTLIAGVVKNDGSVPFTSPQSGVEPKEDTHLTTKKYVDKALKDHKKEEDPHLILPIVNTLLEDYVKSTKVYSKSLVYTKDETNEKFKLYVKKDGTIPFTRPQIGQDPESDSHLTTKRYVDTVLKKHIVDIDPHGFIAILNSRLSSYVKSNEVLKNYETYSRAQIDNKISSMVEEAVKQSIKDSIEDIDDKVDAINKQKFVKLDGTVPFTKPLAGVDAIDEDDLVTYRQLLQNQPIWRTSGPVETTVGFVEDNSEVPSEMTLLDIMDAIFYGKGISLTVQDNANIGDKCEITVCIHGSLALVESAILYQNGEILYEFSPEDFEDGCVTVPSDGIYEDTDFTFKVIYNNGTELEETKTVVCDAPIFIGSLLKWKDESSITWKHLLELERENLGKFTNFLDTSYDFNFVDPRLRLPCIVIPIKYPELDNMETDSLSFKIEAFNITEMIPLKVPGAKSEIIFKIYVYRLALSSLNLKVTFNFKSEE